ncbi:MAG: NAD-dependent epimerase/dehydratase family protein [Halomonas sp.]|nr:NAD-dependent epimerase/dehydratase family protein [Halomonas sp.]MCC5881598.1 NAD-dependent epimerase/dehydratase family protein [Halomonas sp.]
MKILITGARGFVGRHLLAHVMAMPGVTVEGCSRSEAVVAGKPLLRCGRLSATTDWRALLRDVNVVIHCAARAHIMNDTSAELHEANVDGTLNLARQAAEAGVKRLVFLSSIGVNGNHNQRPFTEKDTPSPAEPYAQTKLAAERGLHEVAEQTGIEVVIVRPPLVYGPMAPGNFGLLTRIVEKRLPLPLADTDNRRSLVSVWNLVDLLTLCMDHPAAAGKTFMVSDAEQVSTSDLLRKIGQAVGKPARLFRLPKGLMKAGATLVGKRGIYDKLFDSLTVDASHARQTLGWAPPLTLDEGLARCFGKVPGPPAPQTTHTSRATETSPKANPGQDRARATARVTAKTETGKGVS